MAEFKDGVYEGYFSREGKRQPCEVMLGWGKAGNSETRSMEGKGIDGDGGEFRLTGTASLVAPYRVELTRCSLAGDDKLTGEGFREKSSANMFGSLLEKGEFSLRYNVEQKSRLDEEAKTRLMGELMEMGFGQFEIEETLRNGLNKREAIDRLTTSSGREEGEEKKEEQAEVDSGGMAELMAMGFESDRARAALTAAHGNIEQAVDFLMG